MSVAEANMECVPEPEGLGGILEKVRKGNTSPSICWGKHNLFPSFPWAWYERSWSVLGHEDQGCGEG